MSKVDRIIAILLVLFVLVGIASSATQYADPSVNRRIATSTWGTGNFPIQPSGEWYFGATSGLDYDTTGTDTLSRYRNTGTEYGTTGMQDSNRPSLTESPIQPGNSAVRFNGSTNVIQASTVSDFQVANGTSFSFGVVARTSSTITGNNSLISRRSGSYSISLQYISSNRINGFVNNPSGSCTSISPNNTVVLDKWMVFGFSFWYAPGAQVCSLFVDGVFVDDGTSAVADTTTINAALGFSNASIGYLNGDLAWGGIWTATALTSANWAVISGALLPTGIGGSGTPFPSIQAAIHQATAGDTILAVYGRYNETVLLGKAIDYIGPVSAVFGSIPELYGASLPAAAGTVGFNTTAKVEFGWFDIRGYTSAQGILASSTSDESLFHHLVIDSSLYGVDFDGAADNDSLINCVIDGAGLGSSTGWRATTSASATLVLKNNIIVNTATALTKAASQTLVETNNCLWSNSVDYAGSLDQSDLTRNPNFRLCDGYRLMPTSPLLNRGASLHNGLDGFIIFQGNADIGRFETVRSNFRGSNDNFGRSIRPGRE